MRRQERSAPGLRLLSRPRFRPSRRVVVRVCLWVWMVVRFVSQISTEPRTGHTREPDPTPLPDTRAQAHNHTQNSNTRTQPRDTSRVCEVRLCDPCARALVCPVWVPCPVPAPPGVFLPVRPCVPCVSRVSEITHRHKFTFTQALHTPRRVPHGGGLEGRHAHGELEAHGGSAARDMVVASARTTAAEIAARW